MDKISLNSLTQIFFFFGICASFSLGKYLEVGLVYAELLVEERPDFPASPRVGLCRWVCPDTGLCS